MFTLSSLGASIMTALLTAAVYSWVNKYALRKAETGFEERQARIQQYYKDLMRDEALRVSENELHLTRTIQNMELKRDEIGNRYNEIFAELASKTQELEAVDVLLTAARAENFMLNARVKDFEGETKTYLAALGLIELAKRLQEFGVELDIEVIEDLEQSNLEKSKKPAKTKKTPKKSVDPPAAQDETATVKKARKPRKATI